MIFFLINFVLSTFDINQINTENRNFFSLPLEDNAGEPWPYNYTKENDSLKTNLSQIHSEFGSNIFKLKVNIDPTEISQEKINSIKKIRESRFFGSSNVSSTIFRVLFKDQNSQKMMMETFDLYEFFISLKPENYQEKEYIFASDYIEEMQIFFQKEYGIRLPDERKCETDQLLLFHIFNYFNLNAFPLFLEKNNIDPQKVEIKGIVFDTFSYYDPCAWCSCIIKNEMQTFCLKQKVEENLKKSIMQISSDFKIAFTFTGIKGCGYRPDEAIPKNRKCPDIYLTSYKWY